jgi:hypothetical protein
MQPTKHLRGATTKA